MGGAPGLLLVVGLAGFVAATVGKSGESVEATPQTGQIASTIGISNMLFKDFVYPFELTSFLILVAVLGATGLAQGRQSCDGADGLLHISERAPAPRLRLCVFFFAPHPHDLQLTQT